MKVRFVSGPTTMPVAQNTPRTTRGTHHAFTKWKMRTLTREAAPTATTASRIEIGIRVTMLGHLKCLPNQPASNRMKSAHLRRGNRVGRNKKGSGRHLGPSILCHKPTAVWFRSRERSSLRQHDLDGTHVRRAAVLRGDLLRRDADISHLGIGDEAPADDLGDIDRARDRTSAGLDDDLPGASVEIRDDREHVIHRRFLPDVDDARLDRESATTGDGPESGSAVLILFGRRQSSNAGLENVLRPRFLRESGRAMARDRDSGFHSAAGLIRYFDQEDEKALKVAPWIVVALCVGLSALVLYVTYTWPLQ